MKNSWNGDPSGKLGIVWLFWFITIVVEAILTTDGTSFSTKSAKLSGTALTDRLLKKIKKI